MRFEETSELRPLSAMVESTRDSSGNYTKEHLAGRRRGWGPLTLGAMVAYQTKSDGTDAKLLTVGRVLVNERDRQQVVLQPYEGHWSGARVVHRPYFQSPFGYTLVPNPQVARESVLYLSLIHI